MDRTPHRPRYDTTDNSLRAIVLSRFRAKLRYATKVTIVSLLVTYITIWALNGRDFLADAIVGATLLPIVIAFPTCFVGVHRTLQIKALNAQLAYANAHDSLTRAHTRQVLISRYDDTVSQRALIMVDADNFKRINDTYGHLTGDRALQYLARTMADCVRPSDIVSRYGGEEFAILLCDTTEHDAAEICQRIRQRLNDSPLQTDKGPLTVTVSMGIALCDADDRIEDAFARADLAVYRAKSAGRNQFTFAPATSAPLPQTA